MRLKKKLSNAQNTLLVIKNRISFFDDFTNEEVITVTENVKFVKFNRGEKIFEQAESTNEVYFIVNGAVAILVGSKDPKSPLKKFTNFIRVATLQKKDLFGEMSAFTKEVRSARTVASMDDTTLLSFNIKETIDQNNNVAMVVLYKKFAIILGEKLNSTYSTIRSHA